MHRKCILTAARILPALLVATALASLPVAAGDDRVETTTLAIKGMTCGGCVTAVRAQLKKTPGVKTYDVSLEKGEAVVTYDGAATDPQAIAASVSATGFKAKVKDDKDSKAAEPPAEG